ESEAHDRPDVRGRLSSHQNNSRLQRWGASKMSSECASGVRRAPRQPPWVLLLIAVALLGVGGTPGVALALDGTSEALSKQLSGRALEANELLFARMSDQISLEAYVQRYQANRTELTRLQQQLTQLPPQQQAQIRQQAATLFNQ